MQLKNIQTPLSQLSPADQRALIRQINKNRRAIPKLVQEKIEKKERKEEDKFIALFEKSNLTLEDLR